MKKVLFFLLISFSPILQIYGQNIPIAELTERCISLLDKPVPNEFRQVDKQVFINNEGILLFVNDKIVIVSSLVNTFKSEREANEYKNLFTNFLKNNNWDFFRISSAGAEIYLRNGVSAIIEKPRKNDNGSAE
ncbi:MAG: hypothetical protein LBC76_04870, partial [Treponema sp.]|nr:hypothetical protein [Treponema sp.]